MVIEVERNFVPTIMLLSPSYESLTLQLHNTSRLSVKLDQNLWLVRHCVER